MKRLSMIGMAALLLLAMSCKKNEEKPLGGEVCFRASIETPSGTGKTHLDTDGKKVLWDANDAITVVNGQETPVAWDFTVVNISEDGRKADFLSDEHGVPEGFFTPDYKAYYPASMYDKATGKVSLPSEQVYKAGSFYPGYNPMAAQSDDENLYFKNICGVLMLQLTGRCTVDNITITSRGESKLWGTAEITMEEFDGDMKPTLGTLANGGNSITLKCNNEPLDLTNPKMFCIVLPPLTFSQGFEVKVTQSNGDVFTQSSAAAIQIKPNFIKKMKQLNVVVPGLFSVSDGKQVNFSPGNLQYLGKEDGDGTWRFAPHQYDYLGNGGAGCATVEGYSVPDDYNTASEAAVIDLFSWGTSGWNFAGSHAICTNPWNFGTHDDAYEEFYVYGSDDKSLFDGNGVDADQGMADWGKANSDDLGNGWRTLKDEEWKYLFNQKDYKNPIRDGKYKCNVTVCGKEHCVVVAPDDWDVTAYPLQGTYDSEAWKAAQDAGLVCLPAAGQCNYTGSVSNLGINGSYWSSTVNTNPSAEGTVAYRILFSPSLSFTNGRRNIGFAVRLVKDAN